eukprot:snap_masked-scaffold_12-processed-gene-3.35-mRNA-1 protein AED:1.00 eAED:1.00 QI:0/0/0/0/1/1/3/0/252
MLTMKLSIKESKTSYAVFLEFIDVDKNTGKVNTKRILSTECFQRWIDTRKRAIMHPADSFRRALLAHVRGSDGRRHFPKHVEKSLQENLREDPLAWEFLKRIKSSTNRQVGSASLIPSPISSDYHPGNQYLTNEFLFPDQFTTHFDPTRPISSVSVSKHTDCVFYQSINLLNDFGILVGDPQVSNFKDPEEYAAVGKAILPFVLANQNVWLRQCIKVKRQNKYLVVLARMVCEDYFVRFDVQALSELFDREE